MKRALLLATLLATHIAHAELPSGTARELLRAADAGSLAALQALSAGLPQISIDRDDPLDSHIDANRIAPEIVEQLDPATAALAIGMGLGQSLPEPEGLVLYCTWTRRALALHAQQPATDEEIRWQWRSVQDDFEQILQALDEDQRQQCARQAAGWRLSAE